MDKHTANSAIATIGIDLAKTVFQLHGIDAADPAALCLGMRAFGIDAVSVFH
jgi:hypothetical protein